MLLSHINIFHPTDAKTMLLITSNSDSKSAGFLQGLLATARHVTQHILIYHILKVVGIQNAVKNGSATSETGVVLIPGKEPKPSALKMLEMKCSRFVLLLQSQTAVVKRPSFSQHEVTGSRL